LDRVCRVVVLDNENQNKPKLQALDKILGSFSNELDTVLSSSQKLIDNMQSLISFLPKNIPSKE
jgi:hypothetical protein